MGKKGILETYLPQISSHMRVQNYRNHKRAIFLYHGLTSLAILALLIGSLVNLLHTSKENLYSASLLVLVVLVLVSFFCLCASVPAPGTGPGDPGGGEPASFYPYRQTAG